MAILPGMALFRGTLGKIRSALGKTREGSTSALRNLLVGRPLSKEVITQIERLLIQADVGVKTAIELRKDIEAMYERGEMETGDQAFAMLKDQLVAYFPEEDRSLRMAQAGGLTVILVAGINGAGKTTSIAKLCKTLRDDGHRVLLGACDTFRAAAVEQLEVWSQRLGVDIVKGNQGGDPAAVAYDAAAAAKARGVDVLILDTAGRLHTQDHLMRQLGKIKNVVAKQIPGAPHEVLLVIDATTGQNGVNQAKAFTEVIDVTGIFLTKIDGSARGGIVVAIREALNLPVKLVGTGETPDDVAAFEPVSFVEAMFEG